MALDALAKSKRRSPDWPPQPGQCSSGAMCRPPWAEHPHDPRCCSWPAAANTNFQADLAALKVSGAGISAGRQGRRGTYMCSLHKPSLEESTTTQGPSTLTPPTACRAAGLMWNRPCKQMPRLGLTPRGRSQGHQGGCCGIALVRSGSAAVHFLASAAPPTIPFPSRPMRGLSWKPQRGGLRQKGAN